MIGQNEISGNERFDFYGGHYGRFKGELAAEVRREVYREDIGQTGWRSTPSASSSSRSSPSSRCC